MVKWLPPPPPPPVFYGVEEPVPRIRFHWDDLVEEPEEVGCAFSPGDVCFLVDSVVSSKDISLPRLLMLEHFFPLPSVTDDIDEDKCALVLDGLVDPVVDGGEPDARTVATAMLRNELEELKLKLKKTSAWNSRHVLLK